MTLRRRLTRPLSVLALSLAAFGLPDGMTSPAAAQNLFAPVVKINGRVITRYEVDQRVEFLRLLRAPGDLEKAAEDALIDERLQVQAAEAAGISITGDELQAAMEEYTQRFNLDLNAFVGILGQRGIAPETFRSFVYAGMMWREFVRSRFSGQARVTKAEVDRQLASNATTTSARVLLSRIVLPARPEQEGEIDRSFELARDLKAQVRGEAAFADAARQFSVAPERTTGGRMDEWLDLSNIPPQLTPILLTLRPGEVSDPVPVGDNAIAVFLLRGLQEVGPNPAGNVRVDYTSIAIPGTGPEAQAEAARIADAADSCSSLHPLVRGGREDSLSRQTTPVSALPRDVALELATMDPGETSSVLTRNNGTTTLFLMLCGRSVAPTDEQSPEEVRERARLELFNQRLASISDAYLDSLRADAFFSRP